MKSLWSISCSSNPVEVWLPKRSWVCHRCSCVPAYANIHQRWRTGRKQVLHNSVQLKTGIFWQSYWRWISWRLLWNCVPLSTIFFKINCSLESETRLMKNFLYYLHNLRSVPKSIMSWTGCLGKCSSTVFCSACWCLLISLCYTRRSRSLTLPHWKRSQTGFYRTHGSMTILQRSDFVWQLIIGIMHCQVFSLQ